MRYNLYRKYIIIKQLCIANGNEQSETAHSTTINHIINPLIYKAMKANVISLKSVRNEFKQCNVATIGSVLSVIYTLVNEYKEKQKELSEEQASSLQYLTKILPQSKTQAKKYIAEIEKFGNVGSTRTIKRADGTTREYTIKPSIDMVLRYFVAEYNKNIPEAQLQKQNATCKKHESKQATAKPIECKDENKQTANTMK